MRSRGFAYDIPHSYLTSFETGSMAVRMNQPLSCLRHAEIRKIKLHHRPKLTREATGFLMKDPDQFVGRQDLFRSRIAQTALVDRSVEVYLRCIGSR